MDRWVCNCSGLFCKGRKGIVRVCNEPKFIWLRSNCSNPEVLFLGVLGKGALPNREDLSAQGEVKSLMFRQLFISEGSLLVLVFNVSEMVALQHRFDMLHKMVTRQFFCRSAEVLLRIRVARSSLSDRENFSFSVKSSRKASVFFDP